MAPYSWSVDLGFDSKGWWGVQRVALPATAEKKKAGSDNPKAPAHF